MVSNPAQGAGMPISLSAQAVSPAARPSSTAEH
jgi:predicted small secreted protein